MNQQQAKQFVQKAMYIWEQGQAAALGPLYDPTDKLFDYKKKHSIAGVPGTGAEIFLDYRYTVGAKTNNIIFTQLGYSGAARRLMDGNAYIPAEDQNND